MKYKTLVFYLLIILLSFGCGEENNDTNVVIEAPNEDEQQEEQGTFQTPPMVIINNNVNNNVSSNSTVIVQGDLIITRVRVRGGHRFVKHKQYIHYGRRCPTKADDFNRDGYVDFQEAKAVANKFLIPLDRNIEEQNDETGFPNSNSTGSYGYDRSASFGRLLADLRDGPVPNDDYVKLPRNEEFNLGGRVIIIYGISPSIILPPTVANASSGTPHENFPICCGVIQRVSNIPTTGGI